MRRRMLAKEDVRKAHVPRSSLGEPARNTLYDGLNSGIMSRQRALRLLGGALLGSVLASTSLGLGAKTAAANPLLALGQGLRALWSTPGIPGLAQTVGGVALDRILDYFLQGDEEDPEEAKKLSQPPPNINAPNITNLYSFYNTYYTGGPWIPSAISNPYANNLSFNQSTVTWRNLSSSQSTRTVCNDLTDDNLTPEQVRKKYAEPDSTELIAFNKARDNASGTVNYDTWFTARGNLLFLFYDWAEKQAADRERYGSLTSSEQDMFADMYQNILFAFYVTQWYLAQGYFRDVRDYQNQRYCEDTYVNTFKWYGRTVKEQIPSGRPRLSNEDIDRTAEYAFSDLNVFWKLPQKISPTEARGLAFAWSVGDPKYPLLS